MSISAGFIAMYALLLASLAINVALGRIKFKISFGDGDNNELTRRRRAHGNALEHAVIMIPLVVLYETRSGHIGFLTVVAFGFLLLRLLHATALLSGGLGPIRRYTTIFSFFAEFILAGALFLTLLA